MKFKMKITKEILKESVRCISNDPACHHYTSNCAFAKAYNELVPNVSVGAFARTITFRDKKDEFIDFVRGTIDQQKFVEIFDSIKPRTDRVHLPEQEFDVEIPDKVIEYWYQDTAEAAAKIANSQVLQLVD